MSSGVVWQVRRLQCKAYREVDRQRGEANGAKQSNDVIKAVSEEQRQNLHKDMEHLRAPLHGLGAAGYMRQGLQPLKR